MAVWNCYPLLFELGKRSVDGCRVPKPNTGSLDGWYTSRPIESVIGSMSREEMLVKGFAIEVDC